MKPTKNKIFCVSCKRPKMLFESQAKADNFILYNKEEIEEENGKAPVRSYYCRLCGGWHVTSNPSKENAKRLDVKEVCIALVSIKAIDRIKRALFDIDEAIKNREFSILKYYVAQCQKQIGSIHGPGRGEIARHWNEELIKVMLRAKEVRKGNSVYTGGNFPPVYVFYGLQTCK